MLSALLPCLIFDLKHQLKQNKPVLYLSVESLDMGLKLKNVVTSRPTFLVSNNTYRVHIKCQEINYECVLKSREDQN